MSVNQIINQIKKLLRPAFMLRTGLSALEGWSILLLGLVGLGCGLWASEVLLDDAVITYRVAENLAHGQGFVFNIGERVQVTTTPLYAILLAAGSWLTGSAMRAALMLNLTLATLIPMLTYGVGQRLHGRMAGLSAGLLIGFMPLLVIAFSMESYLYVALILGTLLSYTTRHALLTGVLIGLTCLVRGDGALLGASLLTFDVIMRLISDRQPGLFQTVRQAFDGWLIGPALAIPIAWYLWATAYYGSPFPATLEAKTAQGAFNWLGVRFFEGLMEYWQAWTMEQGRQWLYLWPLLWLIGLGSALRRDLRWLVLLSRDGLYMVGFILLGVPAAEWYYAPLMPGIALFVGCGVGWLSGWIELIKESALPLTPSQREGRLSTLQVASGLRLTTAAILTLSLLYSILPISQAIIDKHPDWKAQLYPTVGRWLARHTNEGANFATIDIGHLGYWSGRPIIDIVGLAQPDVSARIAEGDFGYAMRHYQPDMVVIGYSWLPEVQTAAWFQAEYLPRHYFRFSNHEEPLVLFSRRNGVKVQPEYPPQLTPLAVNLNRQIVLSGYYLPQPLEIGGLADITFVWQAVTPIEVDYTVFVQIIDSNNQIVAQSDRQPQNGFYGTSHWQPPEQIVDRHIFRLPHDVQPGRYDLVFGLYDAATGARLPILDDNGTLQADHVRLSNIRIAK